MKWRNLGHENQILTYSLLAGLPGSLIALCYIWFGNNPPRVQWTLTILMICLWLGFAFAARGKVIYPLQTLSNLLSALREGDYSIRAHRPRKDALGEAMLEVNTLADTLQKQRLGAMESTALLRTVMAQIEVAVFAFDDQQNLQLVNTAGEKLLGKSAEKILGRKAEELSLAECLRGEAPRTLEAVFAGSTGRWELHRGGFWQDGRPHQLLLLSDLSRALREEERQAWRRIIRVLGHEMNNSLAPIKSIAGSLEAIMKREALPEDWKDDASRGLSVISSRADALSAFMASYAQLARLPQPELAPMDVRDWITRVVQLETRLPVGLLAGPDIAIQADRGQLEQLLINLVRNAVDAALETNGKVSVHWRIATNSLELSVEDEGPGLAATDNLFVPFFTTKPGGSGIGLVLSRQIAEGHGGRLFIENRTERSGVVARLILPL